MHVFKLSEQSTEHPPEKMLILQRNLVVFFNLSLLETGSSDTEVIFCHAFIIALVRHASPYSNHLDDNNRASQRPLVEGSHSSKIINIAYGYRP